MESNLDQPIALTVILLAVVFIVSFFGYAAYKDIRDNRQTAMSNHFVYDVNTTHSSKEYSPEEIATMKMLINAKLNGPRPYVATRPEGDYGYTRGLPVYNELAAQYNRKNS